MFVWWAGKVSFPCIPVSTLGFVFLIIDYGSYILWGPYNTLVTIIYTVPVIRSNSFVWHFKLLIPLVSTKSIVLDPLLGTYVEFWSFWMWTLCQQIMSSKMLPFLSCTLQFLSQIECLALKSPSSSNGISLWFPSSRSSLYNISESLGGMHTLPIRVCFTFISTRFQIAKS